MNYREWKPDHALSGSIKCFWTLEDSGMHAAPQLICPDGSMEVVFHLADPFLELESGGSARVQPAALLVGQMLRTVSLTPSGRVRVVGIRFWPGGAWPFLHFPQHEVMGRITDFRDIGGSSVSQLQDQLFEARSGPDSVRLLERFLRSRRRDRHVLHAGLSPRQYRRRFREVVGLPPALFRRIGRFQRALAGLQRGSLAELALDCGYADQAHLTRDFKEFAGRTPSEYLRAVHPLDDHFLHGG